MKRVEFVVGREWRHDVRYLEELRPYRPADSRPNLAEIGDIIDLVIGSNNITASISEESIFPFVADLCEGLFELAEGRRSKAIIEFRREPWELVLVPNGRAIAVTLYSVDDEARVVAHDVEVDAAQMIRAVRDAAQQLLAALFEISESFGSDPFVRRFSSHVGRLRRLQKVEFDRRAADKVLERAGSTSAANGLTLSYGVDVGGPGIEEYGGEHSFDLHALLVPGFVCCEFRGREVVVCDDYPFLALRGVLERARELFNAMESERPKFRVAGRIPRGRIDVAGSGNIWSIEIGAEETLQFELQPNEFLESLVSLAEMMIGDLSDANPRLQLNQRFADLQQEVDSLRAWLGDFGGGNQYLETPEEYLRDHGNLRPTDVPKPEPSFAWPFETVRRLHPTAVWTFEDPHIHFAAMSTTAERLLVPTSTSLHSLDLDSGEVKWSIGDSEPSSYALCGDDVLVGHASGRAILVDGQTGHQKCEVDGVGAFLLDAAHYPIADLIVAADFHGRLTGFRRSSGAVVWRHRETETFVSGAIFQGPLACTLTSTGFLSAFNPLDGEGLWRVRIGGNPEGGPKFHRGRLYTFSHDEGSRSLSVHAIYPFTGRVAWQLRVDGWLAGTPTFIDDVLILPVERYGRVSLHSVPLEDLRPETTWNLELTSAGLDKPTPVRPFVLENEVHGLVRTDRSDLIAFRLADGEIRWRVQTDPQTTLLYRNVELEIVHDAVLSVGESIQLRSLASGRLLHRFGGVMVAPEFAQAVGGLGVVVGEPGADDGDPDELIRHELAHFLAVVR